MEYVMIPVKKETKKLIDEMKEEKGTQTYDEFFRQELIGRNILVGMEKYRGRGKGLPPFVRDKRDRVFDRYKRANCTV